MIEQIAVQAGQLRFGDRVLVPRGFKGDLEPAVVLEVRRPTRRPDLWSIKLLPADGNEFYISRLTDEVLQVKLEEPISLSLQEQDEIRQWGVPESRVTETHTLFQAGRHYLVTITKWADDSGQSEEVFQITRDENGRLQIFDADDFDWNRYFNGIVGTVNVASIR